MNTYNFLALPNFACSYCGIHHFDCVVQCSSPVCNRWFCNTKYPGSKKSHIMNHMYQSRHNAIRDFYGEDFQCDKCGERNIYVLKIHLKTGNISCNSCLKKSKQGKNVNHRKWHPFIMEHRLPYGWSPKPFKEDFDKMIILKEEEIKYLEDAWKQGLFGRYEILKPIDGNLSPYPFVQKAKEIYENQDDYLRTMRSLLDVHEIDDRKRVNDYYQDDVSLNWISPQKAHLFHISNYDYFSGSLKKGSYILVTFSQKEQFFFEAVITLIDNKKYEIECDLLDKKLKIPFNYSPNSIFKVHVRSKWIGEALKRMADALEKLQRDPNKFFKKIKHFFWKESENSINSTNNNPINSLQIILSSRLNRHQKGAVEKALMIENPPITLIQGPPGTGKTTTLYEIVNQINKWNTSPGDQYNFKVLFCAPSNIAVDNLANKLMENKIEFIRVYSRIREENDDIDQKLRNFSLHYLAENKTDIRYHSRLPMDEKKIYYQAERIILRPVNIICCTCSCAGDKRFADLDPFDYVIIDEAAQSLEMETLIPLNHCKTKFVLCGDHKQLGPLVFSKLAKNMGLAVSLFERLTKGNLIAPEFLAAQYRMHKKIAQFPSKTFYEGKIQTQVERIIDTSFPWPKPKYPLMFCDIDGKEEIGPKGISYLNRAEAECVKLIIDKLLAINKNPQDIGVITPYLAQKHFLLNEMNVDDNVAVNSIDGFQGKEKDYIIISCVRSNDEIGVGFLHELNRVNVALTRAKFGLIICGNVNTLRKNEIWGKIISYYRERGILVKDFPKKKSNIVKKEKNNKKNKKK